jgi:hypothetical protein
MKKLIALLAILMIWPTVTRAQTYTYQPYQSYSYDGEGDAAIARYQYERAIRDQDREEKKQWDNYAREHALPIARPDESPSDESAIAERTPGNSGPTNMLPPGLKVVRPPETTSSASASETRDFAEPLSGQPTKASRLW